MRQQLEQSKAESKTLNETVQRFESEIHIFRKERNDAFDERDQLLKMVERQNASMDRLQSDITTLEAQLNAAITSKYEAVAKCDEIEGREHSIEYREKFMEQERNMLNTQIANLTDSLNKNMAELQAIRHENMVNRLQLETELTSNKEELKIALSTISQYKETNQEITNQAMELSIKLKDQLEESGKLMEHYQKELQSKTKLAELYKGSAEDNISEKNELTTAISELKKLLTESSDQYGEMETKLRNIDVQHSKEIETRELTIQQLRDELKGANELLKVSNEENLENVLERLTPTAAAASRRLKSNMNLTEIYGLYVKAVQDLQLKERECTQLEVQLKAILQELEEKAPELKKQAIEYQKIVAANEELSVQLENLITERVVTREELAETNAKFGHLERENKKLKSGQSDLARQVCYLLKEIEQMRGGFTSDQDQSISSDMSAHEVISKKLVTFNDIVELQDNNQKLLLLVRDLSNKLEELEDIQSNINQASYEAKIAQYTKRVQDLETSSESQNQLLAACIRQKDRFKRLYYEIMKDVQKTPVESADNSLNADQMDGIESEQIGANSTSITINGSTAGAIETKDKRIAELDDKVKDYVKQIKALKDEYDEYRKEKLANDKLFNDQFDAMRREVRELTSTNCSMMASVSHQNESMKIQEKNVAIYKKQIQALEGRIVNYDKTISKHEQTISYLKDQTMNAQKRCSSAEIKCEELQRHCRKLQDDVSRLTIERDALYRERQSQHLLQNNLEMIKTTFERSENDGRIRMEQRFDDAQRECSALRRRLQEEQDHFRELSADLKRQTDTAIKKMSDEQAQTDALRKQLDGLREELTGKTQQIDDLSHKLQESLTPCSTDNPIAKANKKIKELQLQVDQQSSDIEQYKKDAATLSTQSQQLSRMAADWESVSKELQEKFDEYKAKMTTELSTSQLNETNLNSRVEELQTEIRLQITGAQINTTDTTSQLHKVQNELKETLQKLSDTNREVRDLRSECQLLKSSLQSVEQKYASEMMVHSSDIQLLTQSKDELNKVRDLLDYMRAERDSAVETLKANRNEMETIMSQHANEKQEVDSRITDLDKQNAALLDQLQVNNLFVFRLFFFFCYFLFNL